MSSFRRINCRPGGHPAKAPTQSHVPAQPNVLAPPPNHQLILMKASMELSSNHRSSSSHRDDDDDNDFSGPALGGHVKTHSDASDDEDDKPTMMRSTMMRVSGNHLDVPTSRKPFKMEVFDL